jgi:DNA modification methylase
MFSIDAEIISGVTESGKESSADAYTAFLKAKVRLAESWGFDDVTDSEVNPALKPHQRAIVLWNVRGGRRADFAAFGLGKTVIELETARLILARTGGRALIILPLGVRQEFRRDAVQVLGWPDPPKFIRTIAEASESGIYLTNYETVREGKLDPAEFVCVILDEASILRGFGGTKTFREMMRLCTGDGGPTGNHRQDGKRVRFRFVATATPAPNEYIELLAYADFLGVMDVSQAKAQPIDAKILTPTGWRPMGEIQVGDPVICGDGLPTRVLGVYPQGERPIYRITFSDGASTEADADHLWLTHTQYERNNERRYLKRTRKPGDWRARPNAQFATVKTTAQIMATLRIGRACNHSIPVVGAVELASRPVAIDPWLLGALLGDACIRDTSITFSTMDEWMKERVSAALPTGLSLRVTTRGVCDYSITSTGRKGGRGPGTNPLLSALRTYDLLGKRSWEKSIPSEYINNSVEVRLGLLRGLMDTDGTFDRSNGATFTSTSAQLATDVVALARSLGGVASVITKKTNGRLAHFVRLSMPKHLNPFSLPRKAEKWKPQAGGPMRYIESVELVGTKPAQCIAIEHPSRLYVTDDYLVTHNTRFFKRDSTKADNLTLHPHKEREFWLWMASWALFVQRPSDLGFGDEGYALPPMTIRWHEVATDHRDAGHERCGQAKLFRDAAIGVTDASREKRSSLGVRTQKLIEIINDEGRKKGILSDLVSEEPRDPACEAADPQRRELPEKPAEVSGAGGSMEGGKPREDSRTEPDSSRKERREASGISEAPLSAEQGEGAAKQPALEASGLRPDAGAVSTSRHETGREVSDLSAPTGKLGCGSRSQHREGARTTLPKVQCSTGAASGEPGDSDASRCLPGEQWVIWCDLNDEQSAIESALAGLGISFASLIGSQSIDEREALMNEWRAYQRCAFVSKPVMYGAGVNLQQCHRAIFFGIGFKFYELAQAIHRCHRFGQKQPVTIDLIYTEAEREVRKQLERKWRQHTEMVQKMTDIIREYGLSHAAMAHSLTRKLGVERVEVTGPGYRLYNNDCVQETRRMETNSKALILTSIPFSTQYEYSPNYADFGHSDNNGEFFRQMDFLTPELLRVLKPGRIAAVHVKDRIIPGGMTGLGFQTVYPFHLHTVAHYLKHGFAYMGMITVVTDVVRENNQTYRLGWTEQCKDGTKMGVGMPEYVLLFRKPPTATDKSYADDPVRKSKEAYTRSRWQIDAHAFWRSSGDRLLKPEELRDMKHDAIFQLFREFSLQNVYDFEHHVRLGEALEQDQRLPVTFMLLQPQSWCDEVWTDITRMLTLNTSQSQKGAQMHLCPMQFDLADRIITRFSMPGETVYDPFGGLMTVPFRAIRLGRVGEGCELNAAYFVDGCNYCRMAAEEMATPALFDLARFEDSSLQATGTTGVSS